MDWWWTVCMLNMLRCLKRWRIFWLLITNWNVIWYTIHFVHQVFLFTHLVTLIVILLTSDYWRTVTGLNLQLRFSFRKFLLFQRRFTLFNGPSGFSKLVLRHRFNIQTYVNRLVWTVWTLWLKHWHLMRSIHFRNMVWTVDSVTINWIMMHIQVICMELALMRAIHLVNCPVLVVNLKSLTLLRVIVSCFES